MIVFHYTTQPTKCVFRHPTVRVREGAFDLKRREEEGGEGEEGEEEEG